MIRRKLKESQANQLVSSQVLSIQYYAAPVGLTTNLLGSEMRNIEAVHYKSLGIVLLDCKQKINGERVSASI